MSKKEVINDLINLSSGTLATLLSKAGIQECNYDKLEKVQRKLVQFAVGALDSDPTAYKNWKECWNYFVGSYDLNTLDIKQGATE